MRKWLCVCMVLLFLPLASCARTQNPALEDFAACIGMTQRQVVRRLGLGEENSVIYEGFISLREPRRIGEVDFDTALRFDESTGRLRSVVLSCRAGSDCAAAFDAVAAFARTCEERYGAPQETAFSELLSYAAYEDVPPNDYAAAVWELPVKGFQRTRLRRVWRDCAAASLMLEVKYSHKARFDGQECRAWISYSCAAATEEERAQEPVTEMNLPGGLRPSILVDGKLYRWTRLSRDMHVFEKDGSLVLKDSATYLPESYIPVGEIGSVTDAAEPAEELQLRAGFEAAGTVYQSPDYPEVVYVRMTTGWFENTLVRFVSDALGDGGHVYYKGRYYRCDSGCEMTKNLPASYRYLGSLQTIEEDLLPQNDLETNAVNLFGERKVFADPQDSRYLLISEHIVGAEGAYDAYRVCRLYDAPLG